MSIEQTINIGTIINLNDLIKSRMLIQANSGGGKSAIARVIMEECYGKVPFIVMDIEGEYYTLKEVFGDIIVIGGQHADVPVSLQLAKQLPKFIIENQLSVVIDVSDMETNERRRFAKAFIESMMSLPQQYWVPYLVFLEECHNLAGEQDKYESGPAVKDLMSRGRKRGYCGIPITQRISKLHKDVAAECNNKFIGRTYLDIDMDRSAKELGFSKVGDRLKLRDLKPGYFYAFGTSIEPHAVHEVKIKTPQTKMPQAGTNMAINTKAPTGKIISILGKLNDELKKDEQKTALPIKVSVAKSEEQKQKELKLMNDNIALLENLNQVTETSTNNIRVISEQRDFWKRTAISYRDRLAQVKNLIPEEFLAIADTGFTEGVVKLLPVINKITANATKKINKANPQKVTPPAKHLGKCALAIIQFLATHSDRSFSKTQIGVAINYSPTSSGFSNSISELNTLGLISRNSGRVMINNVPNLKEFTGEYEPKQYNAHTFKEKLGKCEREIYNVILSYPKRSFTKEELASSTESGYSPTSSGFNNSISKLNTLELIERSNGQIKLNPELLELVD